MSCVGSSLLCKTLTSSTCSHSCPVLYICGMLPWCQVEEVANLRQLLTSTPDPQPASTAAPTLTPDSVPAPAPAPAPVPTPAPSPWAIHGPSPVPVPSTPPAPDPFTTTAPVPDMWVILPYCQEKQATIICCWFWLADWQKSAVVWPLAGRQTNWPTGWLAGWLDAQVSCFGVTAALQFKTLFLHLTINKGWIKLT